MAGLILVLALFLEAGSTLPAGQQNAGVDPAVAREAVHSVAAVVEREYFDARVATSVARSLERNLADHRYDDVRNLQSLADALTADLFRATKDKHLAVRVSREETSRENSNAADDPRAVRGRRSNFGVQRVEILPGNVGYLNVTSFYRPDEVRAALTAAMRLLSGADALILDLRENAGGSPDTVALVAGHMFEAPGLPLFEIISRSGTRSMYSTPDPAVADRDARRPVFVLTSSGTFSAGEGLAFILQERRRAEVVGERTAGAANPGRPYPAGKHLEVTVPNSQVRGIISGRNWEGTGVTPDVSAPASDALRIAHIRALRRLLEDAPAGSWREQLERELRNLERGAREVAVPQ